MKAATQQTTIAKGSWSKLRDGSWGVCVSEKLDQGTVVEVCRRGESSGEQKTLGEYRYHTRAQIWDAVRRLNAGGRL